MANQHVPMPAGPLPGFPRRARVKEKLTLSAAQSKVRIGPEPQPNHSDSGLFSYAKKLTRDQLWTIEI
jgi:hypothetical protein